MMVNSNNILITAPNIILERTSKRVSDFIDAADDNNNLKGNNQLIQALRVFDNIMEADSVWPYIQVFFPTIGGTSFSHKFNIVNPSLYEITFPVGYVHTLSGIKHNGTVGAMATSSFAFSNLTYNNTHLLFAELEILPNAGVGVGFSTVTGDLTSNNTNRFLMHPRYTDGKHYSDHYSGLTNRTSYENDNSLGTYLTQRSSSAYMETRKNGIIKATNTNVSNGSPLSTDILKIANIQTDSSISTYTGRFSCIGVGMSMPNAQALAYSRAVEALLKCCGKK